MLNYKSAKGLYAALSGIEHYRENKPTTFYHYTSLAGFVGMMSDYNASDEENCIVRLHSAHIRFSNDTREFKIGEDEVKRYLKCDDCFNKECSLRSEGSQVFVACFCKGEDLLHQWTCYGSGGGIAIEFDFTNILVSWWENLDRAKPLRISPIGVYYNQKEFRKKVEEIAGDSINMTKEQRCSLLYAYMALRKDKAFKSELESRLIFWPINYEESKTLIKRKILRNIIVPYIDVKLLPIDKKKPIIKSVIVGPSANQNTVFHAVFHTLEPQSEKRIFYEDSEIHKGIDTSNHIHIALSKVPFRS